LRNYVLTNHVLYPTQEMLVTYFYTRFHILSSNYTLVISILPQAHKNYHAVNILQFYIP